MATVVALDVYFDHTCPYSYMSWIAAAVLSEDPGIEVRYHPLPIAGPGVDLDPADAAMHSARYAADWPAIQAMAASEFGLALGEPPVAASPFPAAATAHWVRQVEPEIEAAIHRAFFAAHFENGQDIGDPAVVAAIVRGFGLDERAAVEAVVTGAMFAPLSADAAAAEARGIDVVPATAVASTHLLVGAQPAAVLRATIVQVRRSRSARPAGEPAGAPDSAARTIAARPEVAR